MSKNKWAFHHSYPFTLGVDFHFQITVEKQKHKDFNCTSQEGLANKDCWGWDFLKLFIILFEKQYILDWKVRNIMTLPPTLKKWRKVAILQNPKRKIIKFMCWHYRQASAAHQCLLHLPSLCCTLTGRAHALGASALLWT